MAKGDMFEFTMDTSDMDKKLAEFQKLYPKALREAMEESALEFLRWANNGSANSNSKPPILTGALRGSSSAFVGSKFVGAMEGYSNKDASKSHNDSPLNITWAWNKDYATDMHENYPTNPKNAPHSKNDPGSGGKWAEDHLSADKEDLMKIIAHKVGKKAGTL